MRTGLSVMRLAGLARRAEQAERERGRWAGCGKKKEGGRAVERRNGFELLGFAGRGRKRERVGPVYWVGFGLVGLLWVFGFPFLILTLFSYF